MDTIDALLRIQLSKLQTSLISAAGNESIGADGIIDEVIVMLSAPSIGKLEETYSQNERAAIGTFLERAVQQAHTASDYGE